MNIAFPAFLIFLLILPGFIVRSIFWRTENTQLDHSPYSRATAMAIILSAVLHVLWVNLSGIITSFTIDFNIIAHLLISTKAVTMDLAIKKAAASAFPASLYFISLYVFCWLLGYTSRKIVIKFQIDYKYSLLRFDTPWYYLFNAYGREEKNIIYFVQVFALVDVSGNPVLYSGTLDKYFLNGDGQLDKLILHNVKRNLFNPADENTPKTSEVISDFMVIPYSTVSNLACEIFVLEKTKTE